ILRSAPCLTAARTSPVSPLPFVGARVSKPRSKRMACSNRQHDVSAVNPDEGEDMAASLGPCAGGERHEGQGLDIPRKAMIMQKVDEASIGHVLIGRGDERRAVVDEHDTVPVV